MIAEDLQVRHDTLLWVDCTSFELVRAGGFEPPVSCVPRQAGTAGLPYTLMWTTQQEFEPAASGFARRRSCPLSYGWNDAIVAPVGAVRSGGDHEVPPVRRCWRSLSRLHCHSPHCAAHAQTPTPRRPCALIVPFPAGGATDILARLSPSGSSAPGASRSWSRTCRARRARPAPRRPPRPRPMATPC